MLQRVPLADALVGPYVDLPVASAPANPPTGTVRLYIVSTVSARIRNASGVETDLVGYIAVQDEGAALTARSTINFVGPGVIADDSGGVTRVRVFDPITTAYWKDDFGVGGTASGEVGELQWSNSGATAVYLNGVAGRPGLVRYSTTATINTVMSATPTGGATNLLFIPSDTFDSTFIFRINQSDANTQARIGFMTDTTGDPSTDGIYFERLGTDTNWFAVTRASSTETRTNMSVAFGTAFVRLRMRRIDASTIGFTIGGGTEVTQTANIPTVGLSPVFQLKTLESAAKTIDPDFFDLLITGLSR